MPERLRVPNFWRSLAPVLAGHLIYLMVSPHLPLRARHEPFRIDWGLAVDFWLGVAVYELLNLFRRPKP
jgi:hypothetical protein